MPIPLPKLHFVPDAPQKCTLLILCYPEGIRGNCISYNGLRKFHESAGIIRKTDFRLLEAILLPADEGGAKRRHDIARPPGKGMA